FVRDITPVAGIVVYPNIMLVNPSVPAKTVPELIAYAKANPGKLTMASSGIGSPAHVAGELFKMMAGVDMVHVPYRSADELPGIPTVSEFLPGYEASSWFGLGAPKATPAEIVDKLNNEINVGLVDPKMKARLADLGETPFPGSPADFGKFIAAETEKWAKVVKFAGIKAE